MKVYQELAAAADAYQRGVKTDNEEWIKNWERHGKEITKAYLPSGSGFDRGTFFDIDASNGNLLVFETGYHHMNDGGYYTHWTEHIVRVKGSLAFALDMTISGRNDNDIKEYIFETFQIALEEQVK